MRLRQADVLSLKEVYKNKYSRKEMEKQYKLRFDFFAPFLMQSLN